MGKMWQGFSEPGAGESPGALRLCWGNSPLQGGCSRFVRNVLRWSWWWPTGSGWALLGRPPCDWLERVGGEHPTSPAAGHRGVQRSCISCCRDAPCLCYWRRRDTERSRLDHSWIPGWENSSEDEVRNSKGSVSQSFCLLGIHLRMASVGPERLQRVRLGLMGMHYPFLIL